MPPAPQLSGHPFYPGSACPGNLLTHPSAHPTTLTTAGPVTILNWSFPRKDITRQEQARQVALALREEVADLEAAGCTVLQVRTVHPAPPACAACASSCLPACLPACQRQHHAERQPASGPPILPVGS